MKQNLVVFLLIMVTLFLGGCGGQSPMTVTGAISFDVKSVRAGMNSTSEYAIIDFSNASSDTERPTGGGYFSLYGLTGPGEFELKSDWAGYNTPYVLFSFLTNDKSGFTEYVSGTFTVTAFDGQTISVTFDFIAQNSEGEQVTAKGTLTNIPFNNEDVYFK